LVIIRNANADNFSGIITVINTNSFSLTTVNSGSTSGSSAAYSLGFTMAATPSSSASTIVAPALADCQLLGCQITTGTRTSGAGYSLTVPASATNGAGADSASTNVYFPIIRTQNLNGGGIVNSTMSINTATNFNVFTLAGFPGTTDNINIRANFS
jgi:hypothetical protein